MMRAIILAGLAMCAFSTEPVGADQPSYDVRTSALRAVVYVSATGCFDNIPRGGSGFTFETPAQIITAHHVVGGCKTLSVRYDGAAANVNHLAVAVISKVFASGDLAMLKTTQAPIVPVLKLASTFDKNAGYSGLGYQNAQPSAGDAGVTFSSGSDVLQQILPQSARDQLSQQQSKINFVQHVLRFNSALEPGMSGGPIIDAKGNVIGVVAGGLRAGAAPASWGWPSAGISNLARSNEKTDQPVAMNGLFYSERDLRAQSAALSSGRRIVCGTRTFAYHGTESFAVLKQSTDDSSRVEQILSASLQPHDAFDQMKFDLWTDVKSGATAVTPAGYAISNDGPVCIIRSRAGPFQELIWSANADGTAAIQQQSLAFELNVMGPRIPTFGFQPDLVLSTILPQTRDNGMVFNRKGYIHAKGPWNAGMPMPADVEHSFETLIAKSGSFLGVGTINSDLPTNLAACVQNQGQLPGCPHDSIAYLHEWTRFILATQLSTYPAT